MTRSTLVRLGSGGWIWKAPDCSSHTRAGERRESGDGRGRAETGRCSREGSGAHSPGQHRWRQDKEGSESHSHQYKSAILSELNNHGCSSCRTSKALGFLSRRQFCDAPKNSQGQESCHHFQQWRRGWGGWVPQHCSLQLLFLIQDRGCPFGRFLS